jgi:ABC-type dipeptide/oligopeptide/nickel transport system permease subunit
VATKAIFSAPHIILFHAVTIGLTMLAFSFLEDRLPDAVEPQTPA